MYFKVKQTKTYVSTEIFPPLLLKTINICTHAMPIAKKSSAKGSNFNEDDRALPLEGLLLHYYSVWISKFRGGLMLRAEV